MSLPDWVLDLEQRAKDATPGHMEVPIANGITMGSITPAARDLLDRIMEARQAFQREAVSKGIDLPNSEYGFAYWLVRWSGLILPEANPDAVLRLVGLLRDAEQRTTVEENVARIDAWMALPERERVAWQRAEAAEQRAARLEGDRPNHLVWRDGEWHDDRCGCRYHPDDDNGTHNGAPHVHSEDCPQHRAAEAAEQRAARLEEALRTMFQSGWDVVGHVKSTPTTAHALRELHLAIGQAKHVLDGDH